jgi:DNA-directed RNA polymerase specialized sigma24 family protein
MKESASQVGITVAATKSRLMRATNALRVSFSEQEFKSHTPDGFWEQVF